MSRTAKFIKNTLATAIFQVVTMIAGFALPKIMLTVYGSEINGLVSSITQLISYLTLVEAGLSGAIVYSLYKPLADNDTGRINSCLTAAKNFYYQTGYLFISLVVCFSFVYPLFIKTQLVSDMEITFLFIILSVNGILEFFTLAKYRALLTADQKTYVISLASIVQVVLTVCIIGVLAYNGFSIVIVRLVAISAIFIRTFLLCLYCRKKYKYLDYSVQPDNTSMDKRWDALYLQIIGVVHVSAPVMIATFLLTLNDVSIYSIYYTVVLGVNAILSIFIGGLSAGFGDLIARGEMAIFKKAFYQFEYVYYMLVTIVYSVMMMAYIPFIKIYTEGADINYIYPLLAALLTLNGYFYNIKTPFGMLTISAGKYKESRIQITFQGLLEIVCGIVMAGKWGLNGIIAGAIISNLYRDIDFIFFAPKHLTHYSFWPSLKMWVRSLITLTIIIGIAYLIPNDSVTGYVTWVGYTCVISVIAIVVTLMINIAVDNKTFCEVYDRIKKMISAKKSKEDNYIVE